MGAFQPKQPVKLSSQKGYSFRDTDDRINRLKAKPPESQSALCSVSVATANVNGEKFVLSMMFRI